MPKGLERSASGTVGPDRNDELLWSRADSNITDKMLDVYLQCTNHLPKDLALAILRNLDYNVSSAVEKCNGIQQIPELSNVEQKVLLSIAPAPCTEVEVETTHERKIEKRVRKFLPHVSLSTVRDYYHHVGREECLPSSTKNSHAGNILKRAYDRLLRDGRITIDLNSPYYEKPGQSRILRSSAFTPLKEIPRKIGRDNLAISMVGYSQKKTTSDYDSSPERNPLRALPFNRDPFNRQTQSLPHTREPRSVKDENKPKRRNSDTPTGNVPKRTRGRPRKNGTPPSPPTDTSTTSSPTVVYPPSQPVTTISPLAHPADLSDREQMASPLPPRVSSAQGYSDSSTPPYVMGKIVKKKPKGEEYTQSDANSDESPISDQNKSPIDLNWSPTVSEMEMERMRRSSARLNIGEEIQEEEENRKRKAEEELKMDNFFKEKEEEKKRKKRSSPRRSKVDIHEEMEIQEENRKRKAEEELKMENNRKEKEKVNSEDKDQAVTQRLPAGTERTNSRGSKSFFSAAALAPSPVMTNGPSTSSHARPRVGPSPESAMPSDEIQTDEHHLNIVSQLNVYLPSSAQNTTGHHHGGMMPTVQLNGNLPGISGFLSRHRVQMPPSQWARTPPNPYCQGALRPASVPRLRFPSPTPVSRVTSRATQRNYPQPPPPEI